MQVIGVGVGRTGTYSLKLAIEQLNLGPCHHMEEVLLNPAEQVPLWTAAVAGRADWAKTFQGYESAVDWPTAGFFRELLAAYPTAKFVLTERDPDRWVESFSATIYKLMAGRDEAPKEMQPWFDIAQGVIAKTGFPPGLDTADLRQAFLAHNDAVKATIPADQLLVFQVKEGWEPLYAFLEKPVPVEPFPRSNDRGEFWDRVQAAS
jgi:hypothetical protein